MNKNDISNDFFQINSLFRQSDCMSGDYFEYIKIDENRTGIIVADISGSGIQAGFIFLLLKNSLKTVDKDQPVESFLFELNNVLLADAPITPRDGIFSFYCILDSKKRTLEYSHCGISIARLIRNDHVIELNSNGGFPVGSIPNEKYSCGKIKLHCNDQIIIASNGIEKLAYDKLDPNWPQKIINTKNKKKRPINKISNFINRSLEDNPLLDDIVCIHIQINETSSTETKMLLPKIESVSQKIQIIGKSNAFVDFYKSLDRHAELKNDIVIIGGRGSGKEKAAKYYAEDLLGRSLNTISCGVLDDNVSIVRSEFFGHKRGSFTTAEENKEGIIKRSDGNCCQYDEFQCIPIPVQRLFMRYTQDKVIHPLGEDEISVDVIDIITMNRHFNDLINEGLLLLDFRDRIAINTLFIPSLNERKEDIPELAAFFIGNSIELKSYISEKAMEMLFNFDYPGNIRDLENIVNLSISFTKKNDTCIYSHHMNKAMKTYKSICDRTDSVPDDNIINNFLVKNSLKTIKKRQEKALFLHIAKENDFSVQKIVRSTKTPQSTVYRQLKKFGLKGS